MLSYIDYYLDRLTMYRLVLYYLTMLVVAAIGLGMVHVLPYSALGILYSAAVITAVSWVVNEICAYVLKVPAGVESVYITAFILVLIIKPPLAGEYLSKLPFLVLASALAQVSKYVINFRNKHIFNPAAIAVAICTYAIGQSASWWVGTASLLPFVLIGGLLMVRKVQRFSLVIAFTVAVLAGVLVLGTGGLSALDRVLLSTPLVFFATVMLTEPLTIPPTLDGQIAYGILVGWLFVPQVHVGSFYFAPEVALLVGNVFSYAVSPKFRTVFTLIEKRAAATGIYDFVLRGGKPFAFRPGQYMEWTLGHSKPDTRGNRRYLTIASSPTEKDVVLGVKFYPESSSFKRHMLDMDLGGKMVGGQLAGDFVLPENNNEKLVFVAGGIGVTPFRSMVKYLTDTKDRRDVTVLYANRTADEIAYKDVFEEARTSLGIKTVYVLSAKDSVPKGWTGYTGYIDASLIEKEVPDFSDRTFYISGSHTMVAGVEAALLSLGVHRLRIKTDFFPGLA